MSKLNKQYRTKPKSKYGERPEGNENETNGAMKQAYK